MSTTNQVKGQDPLQVFGLLKLAPFDPAAIFESPVPRFTMPQRRQYHCAFSQACSLVSTDKSVKGLGGHKGPEAKKH
jgi:hypothetical protein